jgi:hypothetical protein
MIWQVEDFLGLSKEELTRLDPEGIVLGMAVDVDDLKLADMRLLDHDLGPKGHVDAGRVDVRFVERGDKRPQAAEPPDLVIRNEHQ